MIRFPQAKINLGLRVLAKRADGYHEIETCMYPIPLNDILEIIPNHPEELNLSGIPVDGNPNDNLIWKAYRLLKDEYELPSCYIHLNKQIPMGAGLGGGSSDASMVLTMLNELYHLELSSTRLEEYAAELGSDCPFFIDSTPKIAKGRGELLEHISIDLSGYYLKLVKPDVHIGTAEAYRGIVPAGLIEPIGNILKQDVRDWQGTLLNDFEDSIFRRYPELERIKETLYGEGAEYAAMSGSGSTLFGLYKKEPKFLFPGMYERIVRL